MTLGLSFLFFIAGLPVAALFTALAFMKIEEIPLINYVAYLLSYLLNPKRYVFRKTKEE